MPEDQERSETGRAKPTRRRRPRWKKAVKLSFAYGFLAFLCGLIVLGVFWAQALEHAQEVLPEVDSHIANLGISPSTIVSSDGQILYEESSQFREPVPLSEIPKVMQDAMIAAEDKRFYDHSGVDWKGIARAAVVGLQTGRFSQGGSTIAMQLAKKLASNGARTFHRKLDDAALAFELENTWSKPRILQAYMNLMYFGSGAYGVKAACKVYFGIPLSQVSLSQAAMLARCVRRPSDENPFANLSKSIANRNVVLDVMRQEGMIDDNAYHKAIQKKVHLAKARFAYSARIYAAPYFVADVISQLKQLGMSHYLSDGGYKIVTTLDSSLEQKAEDNLSSVIAQNSGRGVRTGAFVLLDKDGRILAEVGGPDYRKSQFNIITSGSLQPGSSFKPIVYATAISEGKLDETSDISSDRLSVYDPSSRKTWVVHNDDGRYGGMIPVKTALAQSVNTSAVRAIQMAGVSNVVQFAHDVFAIKSKLPPYPSLALGSCNVSPLEMARAYSVFMLRGSRFNPYSIEHIEDAGGNVVASFGPKIDSNVLDSAVVDQVRDLLRAVVTQGTGYAAHDVPNAMGKTGTTSSNKDAWFDGFTNNYLGVGWVGNQRYNSKLKRYVAAPMSSSVFGGTVTIHVWRAMMLAAQAESDKLAKNLQSTPATPAKPNPKKPTPPPNQPQEPVIQVDPDSQKPLTKGQGTDSTGDQTPSDGSDPTSGTGNPANPPKSGGDGGGTGINTTVSTGPIDRPKTGSKTSSKSQYVTVEVCADSGLLATPYCPEVVKRRFLKGHQPTKYCNLHHP